MENKKKYPTPTGNPWLPSEHDPATVPVPLPVLIVKVEGAYTERDRKLWTFLLHAVWDEIPEDEEGRMVFHEVSVAKINQVFRDAGGDHNTKWIWESASRLARTVVEWEDEDYKGIEALFGAAITKNSRASGLLRFYFPPLLAPRIKKANRFARLRTHFMLGLSGKYAVTLYELLESVVNKIDPVLEVRLDTLRQWLKVPEKKLTRWVHFNQRILKPALKQINSNPIGAGFTVEMEALKKGRAVEKVHFLVHKIDERKLAEEKLQNGSRRKIIPLPQRDRKKEIQPPDRELGSPFNTVYLKTSDYERAKAVAPGWDIYYLEQEWRDWIASKEQPKNPGAAFVAFCRKKYQREGSPS